MTEINRRKPIPITSALEPTSNKYRRDRALFFATALSMFCAKAIGALIMHCEKGAGKADLTAQISNQAQSESIKELLCVTLLVALIEQEEKETPWLKQYFEDCCQVAGELFSMPPTDSVLEKLSDMSPDDVCQIASMNLCHKLGLGDTVEDASIYIARLLAGSRSFRAELLSFSLSAPMTELDNYIAAAN